MKDDEIKTILVTKRKHHSNDGKWRKCYYYYYQNKERKSANINTDEKTVKSVRFYRTDTFYKVNVLDDHFNYYKCLKPEIISQNPIYIPFKNSDKKKKKTKQSKTPIIKKYKDDGKPIIIYWD